MRLWEIPFKGMVGMDIDSLITEVFVRSPLWDQKDKNHHNRFVLDKLWDEVAVKLNTTRTVVRNKWKSLRDKFRTTLASIPKPKSGDPQINDYTGEWKYYKSLLFLKDQFTPRKSKGNFPKNDDEDILDESSQLLQGESDEDDVCDQAVEDIIQSPLEHLEHLDSAPSSVTPSSSRASSSARNYPKKRLAKEDIGQALLQVEKQKLEFFEQKRNKNEEDEDLNFFKSLLPHVRTFSTYDKLEYRMRIMKLTQEFVKPSENTHVIENTTNSNYGSTSSGHVTARNFYNDAETRLDLSQPQSHLYNTYNLLN